VIKTSTSGIPGSSASCTPLPFVSLKTMTFARGRSGAGFSSGGAIVGVKVGEVEARLYPSRSDTVSPARTNIPVGLSPKILT